MWNTKLPRGGKWVNLTCRGRNLYTYIGNDPLDKTNPAGKYFCTVLVGGIQACPSDGALGVGNLNARPSNALAGLYSFIGFWTKGWRKNNDMGAPAFFGISCARVEVSSNHLNRQERPQ